MSKKGKISAPLNYDPSAYKTNYNKLDFLSLCKTALLINDKNHRIGEMGRDHLVQSTLFKCGYPQPIVQDLLQPGFEYLKW